MEFRKSKIEEINTIMQIIHDAQVFLGEQGIDQWQNGYPNEVVIESDIHAGNSYILIDDNEIVATVCVSFDGEPTYDYIEDGKWLSNLPFSVIHRIAVAKHVKGKSYSSILIQCIEKLTKSLGFKSIKVDTHKENQIMQKVVVKNGFQLCGIIYLEDNSERLAYEKLL